jgi:hypothetical protein
MQMLLAAEQREKEHQRVIPIVVARDGVDRLSLERSWIRIGKGPVVRIAELPLEHFSRCVRIDLVTAMTNN